MWRLTVFLLLSTSILQRAVLAEERDDAVDSTTEEFPVYMDGCYVAFLEDRMSKDETDGFYRSVEREAKRGLNVTKMAEMRETSSAFVFMGDNSSAEEVSKMPGVRKVIPDYSVKGQSITWHLDRIDQRCRPRDKHNYLPEQNGTAVDIYVLDSGANFNYSDVKDRLIYPGVDFIDELHMVGVDDQRGSDCHGHGTHIISLATGHTYGVAPGANVIVVRVLDCYNSGPYSAVLGGIELVLKMSKERGNPSVASMSFLSLASRDLDRAVDRLIQEGISVVVAAGNYRKSACEFSPSRVSESITVGATRETGDAVYWFDEWSNSPGSNYGNCVDIFAPGQWIHSAGINCHDCETTRSGTSMSTPLVSGAVALLLQEHPSFTPAQVKEKLLEMSTKSVVNFTQLVNKELAKNTPNRLLYVTRQDGMEAICTPPEPETTSMAPIVPTLSPSLPPSLTTTQPHNETPAPPSPSQPVPSTPTEARATPTEAPTSPTEAPTSPTEAPTAPTEAPTSPTEAPTTPTEAPTTPTEAPTSPTEAPTTPTEAPTTPTEARTLPPQALKARLKGTVVCKDAIDSCVGQPLDSNSPIVYDSLPKDTLTEYHNSLREAGYTLTYLTTSRTAHYAESRYIAIFTQKVNPNSITRLKMNVRDILISIIQLRSLHQYYVKDFAAAHELDHNGVDTMVYSAIFVKDPDIDVQHVSIYSPSYITYALRNTNGSTGLRTRWQAQHVSTNVKINGGIEYYAVTQLVERPYEKYTVLNVSLAEAMHAIDEFHNQGQYLESFQSYWHSDSTMRYNLIFTSKTMGSCNYKLIMGTDRPMMKENREVLMAEGWVPTMVSCYFNWNRQSLEYITVWWK